MSKTLEAIITAPSLVREQWLPTELAVREVLAFERRFGSKHLMLACHAALPLILTPELLNLIHVNFLDEEQISWVAEVDFFLSPLCRPIDDGLFEVEPSVREVLLVELENQFGWQRPFGLAKFLQAYLNKNQTPDCKQVSQVICTQKWIAQAYIAPDNVIEEMTELLEESLSEEDDLLSLQGQIQVTSTLEILADPLDRANQQTEYQYLVNNSRVLAQILYGDEQELKQRVKEEKAEGEIEEEKLTLLSPVLLRQLTDIDETLAVSGDTPFEESSARDIAIPDWLPDWLQECINTQQYTSKTPDSSQEKTELIAQAFEYAYKLHEGQYRASGEPYIAHPVAVASLLRALGGSDAMVAAGFLHDVVEDTDVTIEEIEVRFGSEVRQLVEGSTKLSKFNFSSKTEDQAENFRRMYLALAQDIRVIVVKLADRLHNMRTLERLNPAKQRRISLETREIFAPLANRLGLERFKWELEDLSFKYLELEAYRHMQELVVEKRVEREARLSKVIEILQQRFEQAAIQCIDISGRLKHLYGIYQKMKRQQKEFHEIYALATVWIIVQANEECYRALAIVHDAFQPIPGQFKDYINLPKPNQYQSLHTAVIDLTGRPIQVQIRTQEMHHVAEYGMAAEWKYEETGSSSNTTMTAEDEKFNRLRQLLNWESDLKNVQEDLESIKYSLFDEDIYVFTPTGDVVSLSKGATPVDFAYHLRTDLGNHCAGARVNGRWCVLDTPLNNGDIVEIITQKNSHPSLDWLNFVVTTNARNRIRQWYKQSHRKENITRGQAILKKELGKHGFVALMNSEPMQAVVEQLNEDSDEDLLSVEDLLAALGYGDLSVDIVIERLREAVKTQQQIKEIDMNE